jgi:hypothetical protein
MPISPEEQSAIALGLDAAAADGRDPEDAEAAKQERKQVTYWLGLIKESRDFDKTVYQQMAVDRGYAQGLSAHEVSVNLIGSAVDTMKAHLYAKNPDVSVTPARQTSLPTLERPVMPIEPVNPLPQLQQMAAGAAEDVPATAILGNPEVMAAAEPLRLKYQAEMVQYQQDMAMYQQAMSAYIGEMRARRDARDQRKRFSETGEILIGKAWTLAELKDEARANVGTTLTTAIGWLKCYWQEDAGTDPIAEKRLTSLQENIAAIDELKLRAEGKPTEELDRLRQELAERMAAVNAAKEVVTARGLVADSLASEDMTCPIGVRNVTKVSSCPWLAQRIFMAVNEARAKFPDVQGWCPEDPKKDCWASATKYSQRKPKVRVVVPEGEHPGIMVSSDSDASQFTTGGDNKTTEMAADGQGDFVCIHEIWDKEAGMIRWVCEGMPRYIRQPSAPEIAVTRFYPFYCQAYIIVDGQRYPQSLPQRSYGLQDEYNARRSAYKRQRARAKQGVLFNKAKIDTDNVKTITMGVDGEMMGVDINDDSPMQNVFMAKPVVQLDPMLYEVDSVRRDFEEIWGIEQARQGGLMGVEKTATQVDVEAQGFSAKTSFMREPLESMLNELAVATMEILLQRLTLADAQEYAGPGAVWPEAASVSDLSSMVSVSIKAGSTGKPNTTAERNAWSQTYPLVTETIKEIGALRQAPPTEVADKLQRVLEITLQLAGSSISAEEIVPMESMPSPQPMEGMPGAPADPALTPPEPISDAPAGPPGPF